ncbi:MAG TPA: acyltransferase [Amycolatopsis sp.]|nr:acyltransferase [Amycolatopsis sp.]
MTRATVRPQLQQRPEHLHQVDLFRILTFACVIAVHVLSGTTLPDDVPSNALQLLLHFTREAFFTLTGFVLVYQYSRRPLRAGAFWRRRFLLIGLPYLVWTVVYWAVPVIGQWQIGPADLSRLGWDVVEGNASYHLYFLVVTMQVYLLLPLLMRLLRATAGHHRWVLAASGTLQIGVSWLLTNPPVTAGPIGDLLAHGYVTIVAYQFYAVLGGVVALHFDAVHDRVRRHPALIASAVAAAGLAVLAIYRHLVDTGVPAYVAAGVFQPYVAVWFVALIAALYALSSAWAARRRPDGALDRIVAYGSDRSFGIFLVHPLVLAFLIGDPARWLGTTVGQPWASLVIYLATVVGAVGLTELLRRSPVSLSTTGRPGIRASSDRTG